MHLVPAIQQCAKAQKHAFYVPGHKGNKKASRPLHNFMQEVSISGDLTELEGLDNLHCPEGVIAKAQAHASSVFSSSRTMFLVNGSTCGIHAAVCAACNSDSTLLVSRASHGSVFNAAVLAGCHLATIEPEVDTLAGVPLGITAEAVATALDTAAAARDTWPSVTAVLVTSPTYHGACSDVRAIAEECHRRGVLLIVDEAHGAHLGLHPALPPSAMHAGADVAIQSTHKTLASLTQTSMLHVSPAAPAGLADAITRYLSVFHSTSPSYVLMASLELAAHAAADPDAFAEPLRAAMHVRHAWWRCGGQTLCMARPAAAAGSRNSVQEHATEAASVTTYDPLRVTLLATGTGLSGFDLSAALQRLHVVPEMASENTVVLALGSGSTIEDAAAAERAFERLWPQAAACGTGAAAPTAQQAPHAWEDPMAVAMAVDCLTASPQARVWGHGLHSGHLDMGSTAEGSNGGLGVFAADRRVTSMTTPDGGTPPTRRYERGGCVKMAGVLRGALAAEVEEVDAAVAQGRRAGALVSVYPPGVPLLLYGEIIGGDALTALRAAVAAGARLTGCRADGGRLPVLRERSSVKGGA